MLVQISINNLSFNEIIHDVALDSFFSFDPQCLPFGFDGEEFRLIRSMVLLEPLWFWVAIPLKSRHFYSLSIGLLLDNREIEEKDDDIDRDQLERKKSDYQFYLACSNLRNLNNIFIFEAEAKTKNMVFLKNCFDQELHWLIIFSGGANAKSRSKNSHSIREHWAAYFTN